MTVWLIEGLPGAGKSTLAEKLCELATGAGCHAQWYLEEAHAHPVHPMALRMERGRGPAFAQACLDAWAAFAARREPDVVHILEGSVFQSTVRFMLEQEYAATSDYFMRFEAAVAPLQPRLVYLRSRHPYRHSQHTSDLRGQAWAGKVSAYLEGTPYARARGLRGLPGMHAFWQDYAELCDGLVAQTRLQSKTIEFDPGDWSRHLCEAANFLMPALGAAPTSAPPRRSGR